MCNAGPYGFIIQSHHLATSFHFTYAVINGNIAAGGQWRVPSIVKGNTACTHAHISHVAVSIFQLMYMSHGRMHIQGACIPSQTCDCCKHKLHESDDHCTIIGFCPEKKKYKGKSCFFSFFFSCLRLLMAMSFLPACPAQLFSPFVSFCFLSAQQCVFYFVMSFPSCQLSLEWEWSGKWNCRAGSFLLSTELKKKIKNTRRHGSRSGWLPYLLDQP